jgi:hypothetical protein
VKTLNVPNHIIFGPRSPRMQVAIEGARQYVFSMTNYNLYREESDLDDRGTFTIGSLFKADKNCPYCLRWTNITLPECELTCKRCSMLVENLPLMHNILPYGGLKPERVHLNEAPKLYECELLSALLRCTTTPAERKFAEAYYNLAIASVDFPEDDLFCFRNLRKAYGDFALSLEGREPKEVIRAILNSLAAPALVPQVWFNCAYENGHPQESAMKVPKCVDFMFVLENRLHVVEIDSPSQCGKSELSGKWMADEETYSTRLEMERYLRSCGYEVHRLRGYEILNASESELIDLVTDALGMSLGHFKSKLLTPAVVMSQRW